MRKLCGRADAAAALKITITQNTRAHTSYSVGVTGGATRPTLFARARRRTHTTCTWYIIIIIIIMIRRRVVAAADDESHENESSSPCALRETTGAAALFLEAEAKNKRTRASSSLTFRASCPRPRPPLPQPPKSISRATPPWRALTTIICKAQYTPSETVCPTGALA